MRSFSVLACMFAAACFSEDTGPSGGSGPDDGDGTTSDIDATTNVDVTSGGVPTTGVDASTESADTTGGAATSVGETGEPECDGEGARDDACPAAAPYCTNGTCTACPDLPGGCGEVDPATPVCDAVTGVCAACTEHDECGSGACRIATGECFGEDNRLWVSADADCMAATGSEAAPFCTIDEALAAVSDQPGREPWAVLVAGAGVPYVLSDDAALFGRPFALIGPSRGAAAQLVGLPPAHLDVAGAGQDFYIARVSLPHRSTTSPPSAMRSRARARTARTRSATRSSTRSRAPGRSRWTRASSRPATKISATTTSRFRSPTTR